MVSGVLAACSLDPAEVLPLDGPLASLLASLLASWVCHPASLVGHPSYHR